MRHALPTPLPVPDLLILPTSIDWDKAQAAVPRVKVGSGIHGDLHGFVVAVLIAQINAAIRLRHRHILNGSVLSTRLADASHLSISGNFQSAVWFLTA